MSDDRDETDDLPEQMRVRREKRQQLVERGEDPYPVTVPRTHTLRQVVSTHDAEALGPDVQTGETVSVTGRVIHLRNTGKLCFVRLREGDGTELQAMLSLDAIGEERLAEFKHVVDIGDHLAVTGEVITSRRGELSVMATEWVLAAKTVRPLPVEHKPLSDEARSRMRYVDLIVRPEARENVRVKAKVLQSLRATLDAQEYIEVETPVLQHTNGGAAARPFSTHVNAFDEGALLRIAIELHLKRALVGGIDRVYEIGKTFRNEGVDNTHNPEFMMLEVYEAYGSYDTMAELTRALVVDAARAVGRTVVTARDGTDIDLEAPWRNATLHELVSEAVDQTIDLDTPVQDLGAIADAHDVALRPEWGTGDIVLELFEKLVEHTPHPADVRPRLPGVGAPAREAPPHHGRLGRGVGPRRQRRRARRRVLRAERPGHPARTPGGAGPSRRSRRPRGHGRRRGLPACSGVRHASRRRHGPRRRPPGDAPARHWHPRRHPVSAVAPRVGGFDTPLVPRGTQPKPLRPRRTSGTPDPR